MTTVCTTPPIRPTFDICPHWCAGHEDGYQRWEQWYDGSTRRYHDQTPVHIGGVTVTLGVEERENEGLGAPRVEIQVECLEVDYAEMTDGDAHELGLAIVRAADTARRFRLEQEAGR